MEKKEGGDRNRPHTIDKGGRRKGILPMLGQGSHVDALHRGIRELLGRHDGRCQPTRHPCQEVHNSTQGHPVGPLYSWGQRLGQVAATLLKSLNVICEAFELLIVVFILYMYICGVGANPGNLPCTTCVRPGCKRYTVGGKMREG